MRINNKVVWKEGLFLKPQHFQQQQEYTEALLEARMLINNPLHYGFTSIVLDKEYLRLGRVCVTSAEGVMPDGTYFRFPDRDFPPEPLALSEKNILNEVVYLALPLAGKFGQSDAGSTGGDTRYKPICRSIPDHQSESPDYLDMDLLALSPQLKLESEDCDNYTCLAVARIKEAHADGSLVVDDEFLPTLMNARQSLTVERFLDQTSGLMFERAAQIAERFSSPHSKSLIDATDWALLQFFNRYAPRFRHLVSLKSIHPERIYELLVESVGELSTFTNASRLPAEFPLYDHRVPGHSLTRMIGFMRQALSTVLEPKALALQLETGPQGLLIAPILDHTILDKAELYLCVIADMPVESLAEQFVRRSKLAAMEKIEDLISVQLPGMALHQLTVPPRELPFYSGYVYYRVERGTDEWADLVESRGLAIHIAGELPGLEIELWMVRE